MMERKASVSISPDQEGVRLLDYLAARFTYRSREEWAAECAAGRLAVNGTPAAADLRLAAGDRLTCLLAGLPEPPVERTVGVLYEDADLLAVDKPANLPCHPGGRYFRHTLWAVLKEEFGLAQPRLVNRLDRETSGIVLVAKHAEAARRCAGKFAEQQVDKHYLVVVEGVFPADGLIADGLIEADPQSLVRKKMRFVAAGKSVSRAGQPCVTSFRRLSCANGLSLLEARPVTGRCHQIRATLFSLGFPVVGDKLYGLDEGYFVRFIEDRLTAADRARLRLDRQALHAHRLVFAHPSSGSPIELVAPLPPAMAALLPEAASAAGH